MQPIPSTWKTKRVALRGRLKAMVITFILVYIMIHCGLILFLHIPCDLVSRSHAGRAPQHSVRKTRSTSGDSPTSVDEGKSLENILTSVEMDELHYLHRRKNSKKNSKSTDQEETVALHEVFKVNFPGLFSADSKVRGKTNDSIHFEEKWRKSKRNDVSGLKEKTRNPQKHDLAQFEDIETEKQSQNNATFQHSEAKLDRLNKTMEITKKQSNSSHTKADKILFKGGLKDNAFLSILGRQKCRKYADPFANRTETETREAFFGFYRPKQDINKHLDFDFPIANEDFCHKEDGPFLLILVLSKVTEYNARYAIRYTWGNFSGHGPWGEVYKYNKVKLLFVFGRGYSDFDQDILNLEYKKEHDVIQADFKDSYFNLTIKVLAGLTWANRYCKGAQYLLKTDIDMFIHVPNLVRYLHSQKYTDNQDTCGTIYGRSTDIEFSPVLRAGKWGVAKESYPIDHYPTYTFGNSYVLSTDILKPMLTVAKQIPLMNIEDAFTTGVLRALIGAKRVSSEHFCRWLERVPLPCALNNTERISVTGMMSVTLYSLWKDIENGFIKCNKAQNSTA